MARWATLSIIGGVDYTGCRVEGVDMGPFRSQNAGSVDFANNGRPHVQTINRGVKGIQFGVKMVSAEATKLSSVFAAIVAAEATQDGIELEHTEGIFDLDLIVVPDYSTDWFLFGKQSEGWYEDVTLRFITLDNA